MKSMLIVLESEGVEAQLETALLAARAFGSHMDGVAPRTAVDSSFYGEGLPLKLQDWEREEETRLARAKTSYRDFMAARRIPWAEPCEPADTPSAGWVDNVERGGPVVIHGPLTGLTIPAS